MVHEGPAAALERVTVAELTRLAGELDLAVTGRPRKAELVEQVLAAFADPGPERSGGRT